MDKPPKKVVLAYSGGLDTSIILKWLQTDYGARWSPSPPTSARARSWSRRARRPWPLGVKPENIFIEDLREEFVRDYVFPMFRANTVYEGQYLLGTSIARPLIAKTPDRDRPQGRRRRRQPRRHRQGQRPGPLRGRPTTRSSPTSG